MSEQETPAERVSRFREHTNTNSSIRAPPDELWKDFGTELLLEKFDAENEATPAVRRKRHPRQIMDKPTPMEPPTPEQRLAISQRPIATPKSRKQSDAAATVATAEGTFGRFSRVFTSIFTGVLGKRKAEPDMHSSSDSSTSGTERTNSLAPDQATLDARKAAAEEAYALAKAQGLLPAPKIFGPRPGMPQRAWTSGGASITSTRSSIRVVDADSARQRGRKPLNHTFSISSHHSPRPPLTPRTPGSVARSPSKRDLKTQKRLSKRVSSLEIKLASAKKELANVLGTDVCFPAVPPLPPQFAAEGGDAARLRGGEADAEHEGPNNNEASSSPRANNPMSDDFDPLSPSRDSASLPKKLTKRRKVKPTSLDDSRDAEFHPDADLLSEHEDKQLKKSKSSSRLKRTSSRLSRKVSRSSVRSSPVDREEVEERVVIVRPGGAVPPVPMVPDDVEGKRVLVEGDDGYGGLGHEIF
ncbi:hypothetical protein E8E13_008220 [Curvularia kusanoi]|uniref:Uncharacterized protein n=1 Tax=Curvularia kusanoi TaxID=90978 RepID=A0A9P4TBA5_CURKU|nr:hypothetical protein E8E13_008220 [Curvularia kusanoi]